MDMVLLDLNGFRAFSLQSRSGGEQPFYFLGGREGEFGVVDMGIDLDDPDAAEV